MVLLASLVFLTERWLVVTPITCSEDARTILQPDFRYRSEDIFERGKFTLRSQSLYFRLKLRWAELECCDRENLRQFPIH